MSLPARITALLTSLTPDQLRALSPVERQALADQLHRVYRIIESDRIVEDARKATAPGILRDLRRTGGRVTD